MASTIKSLRIDLKWYKAKMIQLAEKRTTTKAGKSERYKNKGITLTRHMMV